MSSHGNSCSKHHQAVLSWKEYKSIVLNNSSISVQLERGRLRTIEENRVYVKSILESILFCSQQGLSLRGHREVLDSDNVEETAGNVGNFRVLMVLLSGTMRLLGTNSHLVQKKQAGLDMKSRIALYLLLLTEYEL